MAEPLVPEPQDVTLADMVNIVWSRRYLALGVALLVLAAGIGYAVLTKPQYTSVTSLVAVDQPDIIQQWMQSRPAAAWVADKVGTPLLSALFPSLWTGTAWTSPPTEEEKGQAVAALVTVGGASVIGATDRTLIVTVRFGNPVLARDTADAFVNSLDLILPQLQNLTESQLFEKFYNGQNAQDAARQAHEVALNRQYWVLLDPASLPTRPSSPNVSLDLGLAVVLAGIFALVAAFTAHWVAAYRVSARSPDVPSAGARSAASGETPAGRYQYRRP
ncbi:MAG: Wzz/FepE/Etk N-terminal domain-containing protein [Thermoplasmatota archaeon]